MAGDPHGSPAICFVPEGEISTSATILPGGNLCIKSLLNNELMWHSSTKFADSSEQG